MFAKGDRGGGGMTWGFGTSGCKPLHIITWINNEVLLSSTGNYILYRIHLLIKKNIKKEIYV